MNLISKNYYEIQFLKEEDKITMTVIDQTDFNSMKIELDKKNIIELKTILGELCTH